MERQKPRRELKRAFDEFLKQNPSVEQIQGLKRCMVAHTQLICAEKEALQMTNKGANHYLRRTHWHVITYLIASHALARAESTRQQHEVHAAPTTTRP